MIHIAKFSTLLGLSLTLMAGCNNAADEQHKADQARTEAAAKSVEANREASEKINAARVESDKKVADAQAGFLTLREDFRHKTTENLVAIDKKVAALDAKLATVTGTTKKNLTLKLANIRTAREAVMTEYKSLELASALTWDQAKARVEKAREALEKSVDEAR